MTLCFEKQIFLFTKEKWHKVFSKRHYKYMLIVTIIYKHFFFKRIFRAYLKYFLLVYLSVSNYFYLEKKMKTLAALYRETIEREKRILHVNICAYISLLYILGKLFPLFL